jgi:hypothetical protein
MIRCLQGALVFTHCKDCYFSNRSVTNRSVTERLKTIPAKLAYCRAALRRNELQ